MGLLGLLQGHAKPLIERHFLALAGIVTTFYPYLEATPTCVGQQSDDDDMADAVLLQLQIEVRICEPT